jgi:protein phosphatase methylesterase 1
LSFAAVSEVIRKLLPNAGILSLDARHHGSTTVRAASGVKTEPDFRLETFSRDFVFVVNQTRSRMGWETLPNLILVGHSLGGAVVTDVAKRGELGSKILGYAVLDVVEGIVRESRRGLDEY